MPALLDKPKNILLKKDDLLKLTDKEKREEYLKANTCLSITPTSIKNIMIDIIYDAELQLPHEIAVNYYAKNRGSSHMHYNSALPQHYNSSDGKFKIFRLLDAGGDGFYNNPFIIDSISFDSKDLKMDFSFWAD